jgi:shikimate kinase
MTEVQALRIRIAELEKALVDYMLRYGMTEMARQAMIVNGSQYASVLDQGTGDGSSDVK